MAGHEATSFQRCRHVATCVGSYFNQDGPPRLCKQRDEAKRGGAAKGHRRRAPLALGGRAKGHRRRERSALGGRGVATRGGAALGLGTRHSAWLGKRGGSLRSCHPAGTIPPARLMPRPANARGACTPQPQARAVNRELKTSDTQVDPQQLLVR